MRLRNKVAIVTGAASGIGARTAEVFAEEGARLVLVDRDEAGLTGRRDGLAAGGVDAVAVGGDVADPETARRWRRRWTRSAGSTSSSTTPG